MKEKLIAMLKAAGVENPEAVAEALLAGSDQGKILLDDGAENTFIPKARLDAEISKKKAVQASLDAANETLKGLEGKLDGNQDAAKQLSEYQAAAEKAEKELANLTTNLAIKDAIASFTKQPHDISAVMAMLDKDSLVIKDGKVFGLEDQLTKMSTEKAFLFKAEDPNKDPGKGTGNPGNPGAGTGAGAPGDPKKESIGAAIGKELTAINAGAKQSFFS